MHICDSVDGTILWHFRERYTKLPFKCSNTMLQIQINVCHFQAEYIMSMTMHIHCMLQAQFVCVPLFLPFVLFSGAAAAALPLWTETLEHLSGKAIDGPKTVCPRCGYTNKLWMSSAINVMRRRSFFSLSPSIPFKSQTLLQLNREHFLGFSNCSNVILAPHYWMERDVPGQWQL